MSKAKLRPNKREIEISMMPKDAQVRAHLEDLIDSAVMPLVRAVILRRANQILDLLREELKV
jgi:hypothetical protein